MEDTKSQKYAAALTRLLSSASPQATVSQLGNADEYRKHVIEAQTNGQAPLTFVEFQKQKQEGK